MLIDRMLSLLERSCEGTFAQSRSRQRASELSLGTLCSYGRRTISRAFWSSGPVEHTISSHYPSGERTPNAPPPWTSSHSCEGKSTKRLFPIASAEKSPEIQSPTLILNANYCPNSNHGQGSPMPLSA